MTTFTLLFSANTTMVQQIVIIEPNLTKEDIVSGLKNGTYATTIAHQQSTNRFQPVIIELPSMKPVANILSQETEDSDYGDYKLED